ncbi:MAG: hypothetical protein OXI87_10735 [Albidovulum sp.]|nr:hypothetical protein [Albidovulum sp.]
MGVVYHSNEWLDYVDAALLDSAMCLFEVLRVAAFVVPVPVGEDEDPECFGAVGFDGHDVVGSETLGDQASRVPESA